MKRRSLIRFLANASFAWPIAALAQQTERVRRIGILAALPADDPETRLRLDALRKVLLELGWSEGRNLKIDYRAGGTDAERVRANVAEMLAPAPDIVLAHGGTQVQSLLRATRNVPVVFVSVTDPVASGFVESLAQPGGNATGFATFEYALAGKWGELLKQIAPPLKRMAVLRDLEGFGSVGQIGALQAAAQALGVELTPLIVRDRGQIERAVAQYARLPNGGVVVTTSGLLQLNRDLIVALAARHRLPAIYPYRMYVSAGGLVSYGPNITDQYRLAAGYIDRILKGAKPAELPVQHPTKFELVLNLKAAKTMGLEIPSALLTSADEVIE